MIDDFISYVEGCRDKPFKWGRHDCLLFANSCMRALNGVGFADGQYQPYNSAVTAKRQFSDFLASNTANSLVEYLDKFYDRNTNASFAGRGCVVGFEAADRVGMDIILGVSLGAVSAFADVDGLRFYNTSIVDVSWST